MKKIFLLLALSPILIFSQRSYKNPNPDFVKPEEFLFKPPYEEIKKGLQATNARILAEEEKVAANRERVSMYLDMVVDYNNGRKLQKNHYTDEQSTKIITVFTWAKNYYYNNETMKNPENARVIVAELKKLFSDMQTYQCTTNCYTVNLTY